jgi:glutamate synthase (NADPH/NADH) small chain
MGADTVKILYRRDREHMPAREIELDDAISDGVIFKELVRVESANEKDGKIISVNCIETEIIDNKAVDKEGGRRYTEDANTIIFAIGLKPDKNMLEQQGLELNEKGYLKIDENGKTSIPNVYAGGDVCDNIAYVCRAIASGKKAANSIKRVM